jgi:fructosamine-3-kinase
VIEPATRSAVERELGARITGTRAVGGGDLSQGHRLELSDGRRVFLKLAPGADPRTFPAEAAGLRWLGAAGALAVPEVLAVDPAFLVLEWIQAGPPADDFGERLGRGLAQLHRAGAERPGAPWTAFLGPFEQDNTPTDDWAEFFGRRRLAPQIRVAVDSGAIDRGLQRSLERILDRLPALVGAPEATARLHGDLWAGNVHRDAAGGPVLVDPSAHGGHREVDLAMMGLFGGFSDACLAAYDEVWPRAPGHEQRSALYQLHPLLVHVVLFGAGYGAMLERAVARVGC